MISNYLRDSGLTARLTTWSALALTIVAPGCATKADGDVRSATKALASCEIREARLDLQSAVDEDPDHAGANFGLALMELSLLPEAPEVTEVLEEFGFEEGIDMVELVLGPDGVLARSAGGESCNEIDDDLINGIAYPPLHDDVYAEDLISNDAVVGDFIEPLYGLDPKLEQIAKGLRMGAESLDDEARTIDTSACGYGEPTVLQAPELLSASAFFESLRALINMAEVYKWDIPVRPIIDGDLTDKELVKLLNAELGKLDKPEEAEAARENLVAALSDMQDALAAMRDAQSSPDGGLFDWTKVPSGPLKDVEKLLADVEKSLSKPTALYGFEPELTLDLDDLFSSPIDFTKLKPSLFYLETNEVDEFGDAREYLEIDVSALEDALDKVVKADGDPLDVYWVPAEDWEYGDGSFIEPLEEYAEGFSCDYGNDVEVIAVPE